MVRQRLTGKLSAYEDEGGRHRRYTFRDADGTVLGQTVMSRSHRTIGDNLIGIMARELGVRATDFRGALNCPVSREAFYLLMRGSTSP
jgi:hypothetical protein